MFRMDDQKSVAITTATNIERGLIGLTCHFNKKTLKAIANHFDECAKNSNNFGGKKVYIALSGFIREECMKDE